jgi:biopolymer transport protein ExbD
MNWRVRHEGSPQSIDDLTEEQVLQGLLDGQWEPTDEVMGSDDTDWVHLESHPRFADAASELEPAQTRPFDDETRLDMNALIDVCLVLLIFFIITTSYARLQKMIDSPEVTSDKPGGVKVVSPRDVAKTMVKVDLKMDRNGVVTATVEGSPPFQADRDAFSNEGKKEQGEQFKDSLVKALGRFSSAAQKRYVLLINERKVPHAFVVTVQDAAKIAHMDKVIFLLPEKGGGK